MMNASNQKNLVCGLKDPMARGIALFALRADVCRLVVKAGKETDCAWRQIHEWDTSTS